MDKDRQNLQTQTEQKEGCIALPVVNFSSRLEMWVHDRLPSLNTGLEAGQVSLDELISEAQPWAAEATRGLIPGQLKCWEARKLIQLFGFLCSSLEKHFQDRGLSPGTGLACMPGAEELLAALAQPAHHLPRDSHYTNYLWNSFENPLTYTGDPQELFFIRCVKRINDLHAASGAALRSICKGDQDIATAGAIEAIKYATENTFTVRDLYRSFFAKRDSQDRNMEPMFFMSRLRTYKPRFSIKGTEWGGANAGNIASQIQLDYLVGTITPDYSLFVKSRFPYLIDEDRAELQVDMQLPSITGRLLKQLHLTAQELGQLDHHYLVSLLRQQGREFQGTLAAYKDLIMAAAQMSAIHWALIQNYIIRPGSTLKEEEKQRLAVRPDIGVGGKKHEEIQVIMEMRRNHPTISKLIAAVQEVVRDL